MFRRAKTDESWKWRYEVPLPRKIDRFGPDEERLDSAWRQLVFIHTSFRATEQREYRDLIDALRGIERLFFDHPELSSYYDEWGTTPPVRRPGTELAPPAPPRGAAADAQTPRGAQPAVATPEAGVRHVVAMQVQLMEDVYFVLQLARFANALDNRGWMNLFRAWGRSKTFNAVFARLRPMFSQEFIDFYDNYVRDYPGSIEDYPVPHPWDSATLRADPRHVPAAPAVEAAPMVTLPGVFLDSGVQEAGRRPGRVRAPSPSPGAGSRGITEDPSVAAAVEQTQPTEESRGLPNKMPPNA